MNVLVSQLRSPELLTCYHTSGTSVVATGSQTVDTASSLKAVNSTVMGQVPSCPQPSVLPLKSDHSSARCGVGWLSDGPCSLQ